MAFDARRLLDALDTLGRQQKNSRHERCSCGCASRGMHEHTSGLKDWARKEPTLPRAPECQHCGAPTPTASPLVKFRCPYCRNIVAPR